MGNLTTQTLLTSPIFHISIFIPWQLFLNLPNIFSSDSCITGHGREDMPVALSLLLSLPIAFWFWPLLFFSGPQTSQLPSCLSSSHHVRCSLPHSYPILLPGSLKYFTPEVVSLSTFKLPGIRNSSMLQALKTAMLSLSVFSGPVSLWVLRLELELLYPLIILNLLSKLVQHWNISSVKGERGWGQRLWPQNRCVGCVCVCVCGCVRVCVCQRVIWLVSMEEPRLAF